MGGIALGSGRQHRRHFDQVNFGHGWHVDDPSVPDGSHATGGACIMHASSRFDELLSMRLLMILAASAALSGCSLVYKLPTRQGNVIEQKQLDKLEIGMTRDQVKFVMGTPLAASPFRDDRWDYVGYYKSPRGKESARTVSLYFESGLLARMDGVAADKKKDALEEPDVETLLEQDKKDHQQDDEPETGIVIEQQES